MPFYLFCENHALQVIFVFPDAMFDSYLEATIHTHATSFTCTLVPSVQYSTKNFISQLLEVLVRNDSF